jgi:gamma-glutamyltranspeptidase/glutathione hydrolase
MVASDSVHASEAGAKILREGGNAIDAAVATSLALAVTRPYSTGLGGGGFFMVRLGKTGETVVLDARERAPAAATRDLYTNARRKQPDAPPLSRFGGLAVGVPGLPAGHAWLIERFGSRPWRELAEPARELAVNGFAVDAHHCGAIRGTLAKIAKYPVLSERTVPLRRALLFDGDVPEPGTILRRPQLARTLRSMADNGPMVFYRGTMAGAIVEAVRRDRGIINADDLARYQPVWRSPIRARYRERFELLLMPPPSSGGVCIAEALNILEHWNLRHIQREDPGLGAHLLVEALKHAFADRARHLGDADFAKVPVAELISKDYAARLAGRIRENATGPPDSYGTGAGTTQPNDDAGTSHYCVADRWGNIVSATETINTTYGSLLFVESLGIVLNNEMDDFTTEPGRANTYGLRQSDANTVAPLKRPLSCMSPTIVLDEGSPILAVGASGGPRIITATLQVMLNVIEHGCDLRRAISQPRLHHQWRPDVVYRNKYAEDAPAIVGLEQRGHVISGKPRGAVVQAIRIDGGTLTGVSDPRKGGRPAGP